MIRDGRAGGGLEYTQFQAKHKNLNNESTGSISEPQDFKIFWGTISPGGSPTVHIGACVARLWAPPPLFKRSSAIPDYT